jgi:tripartite-type tricarboxylate transporter receptor subunit TctC
MSLFWARTRVIALGLLTSVGVVHLAKAQSYPDHSVRIVVAFGTGGTIDTLTRIIADKLGDMWKQGVIVENRPGGAGNIGAASAAHAAADGYTLHMGGQPLTANVTLAPTTTFDPLKDFEPIVFIAGAQDVLMVGKDSPYKTAQELIAAAKAAPGTLNYGSLGIGSSGHLATVLLSDLTGIRVQHVPYTSVGQLQADTTSGRINMWISTYGGQAGVIKGGNLRALAVSGEKRVREQPDVPTFNELGIAMNEPSSWFALFAPKGTPKEIIAKINADVNTIINAPEMREKLEMLGFSLRGGGPEVLAGAMQPDIDKWAKVAKSPAYSVQ